MDEDRFTKLTEAQRACLRLVAFGASADEVAGKLGITANAVNERLRAARQRLGATSSRQAALELLRHEDPEAYKSLVDGRIVVPDIALTDPNRRTVEDEGGAADGADLYFAEDTRVPFTHDVPRDPFLAWLGDLWIGRKRNDLTTPQRLAAIARWTLAFLFGGATLILAFAAIIYALYGSARH